MAGGFFGGLAEGLDSARARQIQQQQIDQQGKYQQGLLSLDQQRLQNEQRRQNLEYADKSISDAMSHVDQTIQSLRAAGKSTAEIAKVIAHITQPVKTLAAKAGRDPAMIDAQIATSLAQPSASDILNGSGAAQPTASPGSATAPGGPSRSSPSDIPAQPSGTGPQPPGQNLTDQKIVGIEPVSSETMDSTGKVISSTSQPGGAIPQSGNDAEIRRLETVVSSPGIPDSVKSIAKLRLQEAMKRRDELPQYFKTSDPNTGEDKIVGVDKRTGRQFDVVDNSMGAETKAKLHSAFENDLHGAEFIQAVPAEMRNEVKAIATYKQNPNTSSIRGGQRERVLSWVHQYNPEYDQNVFSSKNKSYQVVGNRIGAIQTGLQGAVATAPRVLETSDKVNRTNYPSLNAIILAAKQGSGDPNVVNYGIAVNTFIMNYARAMGGGSTALTDSARVEAQSMLQKAWSQGQIKSAIGQMMKEMQSELKGSKEALGSLRESYGDEGQAGTPQSDSPKSSAPPPPPPGFVITGR